MNKFAIHRVLDKKILFKKKFQYEAKSKNKNRTNGGRSNNAICITESYLFFPSVSSRFAVSERSLASSSFSVCFSFQALFALNKERIHRISHSILPLMSFQLGVNVS